MSLDVVSLFTKVPTDETLAVVWDELDCILIDNLMEMLTFCVETIYFGMGSDIYRQERLAMGSPLSPVLANVYMEYFEEMALGSTSLKPSMWLRFVHFPVQFYFVSFFSNSFSRARKSCILFLHTW